MQELSREEMRPILSIGGFHVMSVRMALSALRLWCQRDPDILMLRVFEENIQAFPVGAHQHIRVPVGGELTNHPVHGQTICTVYCQLRLTGGRSWRAAQSMLIHNNQRWYYRYGGSAEDISIELTPADRTRG